MTVTPDTLREYERLLRYLQDVRDMTVILREDVVASGRALSPSADWTVRAWVRASFAFVEGGASAMAALLLEYQTLLGWELTDEEVASISDGRTASGKRRRTVSLTDRVKCSFKVAARVLNSPPVDFGGREWVRFQTALQVRHRLMHPKASSDCLVTVQEMQTVEAARDWFRLATEQVMLAGYTRMQSVFASARDTSA